MNYHVTLLGTPDISKAGETIYFPYRKAEGVFYYLCVEKTTNRDELVSLFWGSSNEDSGRKSLRQALFHIRRCLGDNVIILQGRNGLKLNQHCGIQTDWDAPEAEFALSRQRFLDFFYLRDCPEFDAWVERQREVQISRCLSYIENQLKSPVICADASALKNLMEIWQFWKPWDEKMILTGMKCYAQAENYALGIQLYQEYVKRLQNDLSETPSHAVELLYRTLLHRKKVSFRRHPSTKDTFFCRWTELQTIDEQIFRFLNEETTASVVIEGEVGIGKTALMRQIYNIDYGPNVLKLVSHCYNVESTFSMKSWRDLFVQLDNLCGKGELHLSEASMHFFPLLLSGHAAEEIASGTNSGSTLTNSVLALFKELTSQRKILLFFDSLQWMDKFSQQLLQRIMIEFGNEQVFLLATCRSDEKKDVRGLLLALQERSLITPFPLLPFTEVETKTIIDTILQPSPDSGINARDIFLRTEGNPLVLMETLRVLKQTTWNQNCPTQIDMLIQLRLEQLDGQQRRVLDALSVHFEHANLEDLEILTGMNSMELVDVLDTLLNAGFIVELPWGNGVVYKFKYQYYKDYIYQSLSMGKRQLWHRVVAEFYDKQKTGDRWRILLPYTIRHYEYCGNAERAATLRETVES